MGYQHPESLRAEVEAGHIEVGKMDVFAVESNCREAEDSAGPEDVADNIDVDAEPRVDAGRTGAVEAEADNLGTRAAAHKEQGPEAVLMAWRTILEAHTGRHEEAHYEAARLLDGEAESGMVVRREVAVLGLHNAHEGCDSEEDN